MTGMKAEIKKFLKGKSVKVVIDESGKSLRLGNAKTSELLKAAVKLGY